jgi:transcriptional regulator with XRE-family HTH domain
MQMYSVFEDLMKRNGYSFSEVGRATGIAPSTFTDWRAGRYTPKHDKLQRIADFFGVSIEYLTTGKDAEKQSAEGNKYYFDDNAAAIAQDIYDNPRLRALMDAARDCDPEDLKMAADMLLKFKRTNPNG